MTMNKFLAASKGEAGAASEEEVLSPRHSRVFVLLLATLFLLAAIAFTLSGKARAEGPASVADLAERLTPTVVNISTSKTVSGGGNGSLFNFPPGTKIPDLFKEFLERNKRGGNNGRPRRVRSLGSGFVIDPAGIIITNNHVIADAADAKDGEIIVRLADGAKLKAKVMGRDKKTDIAVLKVNPDKPLKAAKFGDSSKLRVGDWVMAIGNPFGLSSSVSMGIVSARNRDIRFGPYDDFIQTDAAINKGNSGGPLFNMAGEVVGINSAIISPSGGSIGIGFSVPASIATPVIKQLRQFGVTRRGWLGVRIQPVNEEIAESLGLDKPRGALVSDVIAGAPAASAGMQAGDVILRFNGHDIPKMRELQRVVADTSVGQRVDVVVLRKRHEMTLSVKVGRLEDGEKKLAALQKNGTGEKNGVEKNLMGLTVSSLNDELRKQFKIKEKIKGVVITKVDPTSAAAEKRIRPGDVILEVGQVKVSTPADVARQIRSIRKQGLKTVLFLLTNAAGELRFEGVRVKGK